MNTNKTIPIHKKIFNVKVPNLDGKGIAEIVPIEVKYWIDPTDASEILTQDSLDLIETVKARRMGLLLPNEIKNLRLRIGLTQKEISELLQIGEKSYTRWESGKARPSRSINVLLCALRDGKIDVEYLRKLGQQEFDWASRVAEIFDSQKQACTGENIMACMIAKQWDLLHALKLPLEWEIPLCPSALEKKAYTLSLKQNLELNSYPNRLKKQRSPVPDDTEMKEAA